MKHSFFKTLLVPFRWLLTQLASILIDPYVYNLRPSFWHSLGSKVFGWRMLLMHWHLQKDLLALGSQRKRWTIKQSSRALRVEKIILLRVSSSPDFLVKSLFFYCLIQSVSAVWFSHFRLIQCIVLRSKYDLLFSFILQHPSRKK